MTTRIRRKRRIIATLVVVALLAIAVGAVARYKSTHEVPQSARITGNPELNFLYGSIGSEERGLPYWVVVVLPRVFGGEYLPGPGGYAALGLSWQEGTELPAGFSKKTIGVERVGFNCALCHTAQYRLTAHETPTIVAAGGSQTVDINGLRDFFSMSASDARFDAVTILTEIDLAYRLSWIDRLLYTYVLIPKAKTRLLELSQQLGSAHAAAAASATGSKIPSLWRRAASVRPMVVNSVVERGSNDNQISRVADELDRWLKQLPAPRFPIPMSPEETTLAAEGKPLFEQQCASCHASGTDAARTAARPTDAAPQLDGLWLRGPYLRDGSVPTVRDLLEPAICRPKVFYRAYDVIDADNLGFVATQCGQAPVRAPAGCEPVVQSACVPPDQGRRFETGDAGKGSGGHEFGTRLSAADKRRLIAFLKTF